MELDLFGLKLGKKEEETKEYKEDKSYKITKEQLIEKLGFKTETVTFIQYEYKTGILTIKGELK